MNPDIASDDEDFMPEAKVPKIILWYVASFAAAATLISFVSIWNQCRNYRMAVRVGACVLLQQSICEGKRY